MSDNNTKPTKEQIIESKGEDKGELVIRTLAMPSDTNINGDIFGGWVLSQMDLGGQILACKIAQGKTVTIAVNGMKFISPISIGDVICIYAKLLRVGKTSITFKIKTYVTRKDTYVKELVTHAEFTYVHIGKDNKPEEIQNTGQYNTQL